MKGRGDRGAATAILLIGMAFALVAMTMLLGRIARANDMRSRAQTAADSAALAAAAEIRDRGAIDLVRQLIPQGETYKPSSEQAAKQYAAQNGAVVDDVHPSGLFGLTVKVSLHTQSCETTPSPGQPLNHFTCKPQEHGMHGSATAIARVTFPVCDLRTVGVPHGPRFVPRIIGVFCDGQSVHDFGTARRMFSVRLVDEEDPVAFDPLFTSGVIPPGGVANEHNRELGQQLAAQIGWTGDQWGCLDQLWQHESGWNHLAENPSSGAYGIPQSLPPEKMAKYGADYRSNPVPQIRWGLEYIADTYGNPCNAWGLWQSRDPHWY